ncbi:unnamed protein product [Miscanthus lutarioriparius]|uniref:DUF7866 domain-containing protein n=1 Tax=Miscanthus lutarioriparius TaxID=422564 RepID=A0A811QFK9_9POAL|nr:unnamed protein product [Miscanthus lutarioriparius]
MASCSSSPRPPIPLLLLLLFLLHFSSVLAASAPPASSQQAGTGGGGNVTEPAAWTPRLRKTFLDGGGVEHWRGRRLVGRFQVCAVCTCCGGPHGMCIPAPCCYAINCNIPNRPFGVCSFTPRTCNCFNCHL